MATSASGITIPGDSPSTTTLPPLESWFNNLGKSLNGMLVVPVASTTARTNLVTALSGESFTPSTSRPLYVHRADAGTALGLEYTVDGTNWVTVGGKRGATAISGGSDVTVAHGLGYAPTTVNVQVTLTGSGSATVAQLAKCMVWAIDATNFTVRTIRIDTQAVFTGNTVGIVWHAI